MVGEKNYIGRVAIVGAGGNSGKYITDALVRGGRHIVTAITRIGSNTKLPHGIFVKHVDYDSHSSLVEALRGQDALIITMGLVAPKDQQLKLIRAAAEAEVPWIFPNEFAGDSANETTSQEALMAGSKKQARDLIEKLGKSSWVAVSTGFWYEWSMALPAAYGFDLDNRIVTLFDEGETRITTTTLPQLGRAMLNLLSLKIYANGPDDKTPCLDQFRNNWVYVSSFTVSQKEMLGSVLRVTDTNLDEWTVKYESSHHRYRSGLLAMKRGDRMGFVRAMYTRAFFPDGYGNVEHKLADELLGLPVEELDDATRRAFERAQELKPVLLRYEVMPSYCSGGCRVVTPVVQ